MKISAGLLAFAILPTVVGAAPSSPEAPLTLTHPTSAASPGDTVETKILVHVLAHHAKLIGSSVGGAQVTITEVETGRVLAQGITEGGTGNTDLIMGSSAPADEVLSQSGGANFQATVRISDPTRIEVKATGPLAFPQAIESASKTFLLFPGQEVSGDGIVLELNGFIVEILEPGSSRIGGAAVTVRARVRMLCSCTTSPGGIWPSPTVRARLLDPAGSVVVEADLPYAGEPSTYQGTIRGVSDGAYQLEVVAISQDGSSVGVARRMIGLN